MQEQKPFRGIFTIPSTPFKSDGQMDISSFRRVVDFCIDCGAHGLVFPVNASEWTHLSDAERFELSEVMIEQNAGRQPIIIGVTAAASEIAVKFATHARQIGANGVIAMPPHIRRSPHPKEVIYKYYENIAAAAQLPVIIQNWVGPIGTELSAEFMLKMCREIEHVDYIKEETVPSTVMLTQIVDNNDGFVKGFFGGSGGRYLIEEFRRGVDGNMPGCHVTDIVVALWKALESEDAERAMYIYKEMAPLFFFEHQLPGCYKEVLFRRGIIDCPLKRNGRMPLDEISSEYLDEILTHLKPLMIWGR